ncbi:hypothetical protein HA402_013356 [Bradysia odoriphaga]|nr:hypothetical protein HA402_013356 [Bradysia odoriphaga]
MKCGSCRVTDANQYQKINQDENLLGILKNMNVARGYNPKYAYFCETCVKKAKILLDHKRTTISDRDSLSFNLTGDSTIHQIRPVTHRKNLTGTPPERSEKPLPRPKPCPKRFKKLQSIPKGADRQEPPMPNITTQTSLSNSNAMELGGLMMSSPSPEEHLIDDAIDSGQEASVSGRDAYVSKLESIPKGVDRQEPPMPNITTQTSLSNSNAMELDGLMMSSPEEQLVDDEIVSGHQAKVSGRDAYVSGQDANVSNSSFVVDDRGAGGQNSSFGQSKRQLESRTQHRQSPTEKSDTESDQSMSKKSRSQPRRPSAEKKRTQPGRASTKKTRTQPRVSTGKDDTNALSHDGDTGTLAPANKNARIRIETMPRNVQEYFSNDSFVNVNFHARKIAG